MSRLITISLLLIAGHAHAAGVYKCYGPTGNVTYTSIPCFGDNTGKAVDITHNVMDYSGSRRQAEVEAEEREEQVQRVQTELEILRQSSNPAVRSAKDYSEAKERLLKELSVVKRGREDGLGGSARKHKKEVEIMRLLTDLEIAEGGGPLPQIKSMRQEKRLDDLESRVKNQGAATTQIQIEQQRQKAMYGHW